MRGGNVTLPSIGGPQAAPLARVVHEHLEQLLRSQHFDGSARSREFLCHVVEETLAGRGRELTQCAIGVAVFGRKQDFDAVLDPIVRVQAGRLRRSLERYYLLSGDSGSIRIELPKGGYTPVFRQPEPPPGSTPVTVIRRAALTKSMPDRPIVLIHPFAAGFPDDAEPASRFEDEMTMELSRYGDVQVVRERDMNRLDPEHRPSARFELSGTLRSAAGDRRVDARLVDCLTGEQVWSDEYHTRGKPGRWSGSIDDIGRLIAARIGSEQGVIARVLVGAHDTRSTEAAGNCSAIIRCYQFFSSRQTVYLLPAIEAVRQLLERRPENALGWTYLARLYLANHSFELSPLQTPIDKAIGHAYQALLLDNGSARVRCVLAAALLVKGELAAARDELEQAGRLNGDSFVYREIIGWLLALAGDWQRGVAIMQDTIERNPYCLPHVHHGLWADHLQRGDFERAYIAALEYRDQSYFWRELMLACSLGHLGRQTEAHLSAAELLRIRPQLQKRGRTLIGYYIKSDELRERVVEGLHKAGLILE